MSHTAYHTLDFYSLCQSRTVSQTLDSMDVVHFGNWNPTHMTGVQTWWVVVVLAVLLAMTLSWLAEFSLRKATLSCKRFSSHTIYAWLSGPRVKETNADTGCRLWLGPKLPPNTVTWTTGSAQDWILAQQVVWWYLFKGSPWSAIFNKKHHDLTTKSSITN